MPKYLTAYIQCEVTDDIRSQKDDNTYIHFVEKQFQHKHSPKCGRGRLKHILGHEDHYRKYEHVGSDRVGAFASKVGVDTGTAADGLADVLPQVMDKASSGGSLLDMAGGASGLLGAAKSLFG